MLFDFLQQVSNVIAPSLLWHMPRSEQAVYLTFDDGPTKEATEFVLDLLKSNNAKASFFCIGANVNRYPELYKRILSEGHRVGNHTMNHRNGWKSGYADYLHEVNKCRTCVDSNLFRPPYGKLGLRQYWELRKTYRIVMWDVLSRDFESSITPMQCMQRVEKRIEPGSLLVFHDSERCFPLLQEVLPSIIELIKRQGLAMKPIL